METAIGVFASRDHAEEAVRELRKHGVPQDSIVYLTRSRTEAETVSKEFGATVGGFVGGAAGMSAGVVAATLLFRASGQYSRLVLVLLHCLALRERVLAQALGPWPRMTAKHLSRRPKISVLRMLPSSGRCSRKAVRSSWSDPNRSKPRAWRARSSTASAWACRTQRRSKCKLRRARLETLS